MVPERIDEPAEAVTPEHVGRLHRCPAASVNGPPEGGVHVGDVEEQRPRGAAERLRRTDAALRKFITEHHD